jgi:flavin reductase (DIM6/NTAB) family NADH-FMN oxidoreductase RutF
VTGPERELMPVEVDEALSEAPPAVDRATFVAAMAAFPTGVTVVTTTDRHGRPLGLTCNAFTSVSTEPPLVLVSLDRGSNTLPALLETRRFVVNFLAAGRGALARRCAGKGEEKFAEISWTPSAHGLPVLEKDSIAYVICRLREQIQAGDHVLLLGAVLEARAPEPDALPLLYFRREYDSWPVAG